MSRFQVPTTRQRQCLIMAAAFFVGKEKNNIKSVSETQQATKLYFFPQEEQGGILLFFTKEFQSEEKERQREKKLSQSQRQCFKTQKKNKNPISNGDVPPPFQLLISSVQRLTCFWGCNNMPFIPVCNERRVGVWLHAEKLKGRNKQKEET